MRPSRHITTALVIVFAALLVECGPGVDPLSLERTIRQVGEAQVPDTRLDVWDLRVEAVNGGYVIRGETTTPDGLDALQSLIAEEYVGADVTYAVTVLPDSTVQGKTHGIVRVSVAHVRREPDQRAEMITQTVMGAPVRILKEKDGYYFGRMEDGYLGWLSTFSVNAGDVKHLANWQDAPMAIYNRVDGRIYQEPSHDSPPVSDIVLSSRVRILGDSNGWVRVEIPDGRTGYIPSTHLLTMDRFQTLSPAPEHLVELSKKMLGTPYIWGGTSTKGFDCSGFTQTIYKMNGLLLPRDANMQVDEGTDVDTSDNFAHLRPGDLLFFGRKPGRITHVGMYIGEKEFIHSSGMVKINSLDPSAPHYSNYRHSSLQKVKRLF